MIADNVQTLGSSGGFKPFNIPNQNSTKLSSSLSHERMGGGGGKKAEISVAVIRRSKRVSSERLFAVVLPPSSGFSAFSGSLWYPQASHSSQEQTEQSIHPHTAHSPAHYKQEQANAGEKWRKINNNPCPYRAYIPYFESFVVGGRDKEVGIWWPSNIRDPLKQRKTILFSALFAQPHRKVENTDCRLHSQLKPEWKFSTESQEFSDFAGLRAPLAQVNFKLSHKLWEHQ